MSAGFPRLRGPPSTTTRHVAAIQAGLATRLREISEARVRYGYRRVHVLLRREGWTVNMKRIYRELGLQLRNKTPKRRPRQSCRKVAGWRAGRMRPRRSSQRF